MSLVPRNNFFDIDRFFNDSWPQGAGSQPGTFFAPRVDIKELGDHYEITAELPGVAKEDIHVDVKDGKYMRSFNLGSDVHEDDIKASFKDGVLTLQAPKRAEKAPERRRIEIQ